MKQKKENHIRSNMKAQKDQFMGKRKTEYKTKMHEAS
jgi:hypothetical protein